MYSLYIPKYKDARPEFLITKIIFEYMWKTDYKNNILSSPGYMGTTDKTIDKFLDEFLDKYEKTLPPNAYIHIGFFHGMNGRNLLPSTGHTILEHHGLKLSAYFHIRNIPIMCAKNSDHRKILFFFNNIKWDLKKNLNLSNYKDFLNEIQVNAILIGSSNQNHTTYYGGSTGKAAKGEADLLLFTEDVVRDYFTTSLNNYPESVLFESLMGADEPHDYLKRILEDFLKNSLA